MIKRSVDAVLSAFLLIATLPFLALSSVLFAASAARGPVRRSLRMVRRSGRLPLSEPYGLDSFRMERAIDAYEQLIDATFQKQRA